MITKRQMLELIQNRLAGGDPVVDVRKQYPLSIISRVLNFIFADVVANNDIAASDMSIDYSFEVQQDAKGYYVSLYPQPIAGTLGIYNVSDGKNTFHIQDKQMARAIQTMRGENKYGAIFFGKEIRFNTQPTDDVVVTMVPNIYQMADDDILISAQIGELSETRIFQTCFQLLKSPEYQDELNNNNIDSQNPRQR